MSKMATSLKKKIFLTIFCLASITQGMYSTYFVSILTTIESIYQIQSKTAGALLSATEIGQILGSLFIAHYGGRGNKPKWIAACMLLSALAALISISPHFFLITMNKTVDVNHNRVKTKIAQVSNATFDNRVASTPQMSTYQAKDLNIIDDLSSANHTGATDPSVTIASILTSPKPKYDNRNHLCRWDDNTSSSLNLTKRIDTRIHSQLAAQRINIAKKERIMPVSGVIIVFFICLLAIGFGSTAITTLGIPFIDDIISKEESPLYLGLTIGLKIFGPAFGFLLGSYCIQLDTSSSTLTSLVGSGEHRDSLITYPTIHGAWWLGLIIISVPLLILSIPMYYISRSVSSRRSHSERDNFEEITYQAAEDHDIGGSHEFPAHVLGVTHDLDVSSNRSCFSSEIDSSSREVLQNFKQPQHIHCNYVRNLALDQPKLSNDDFSCKDKINISPAIVASDTTLKGQLDNIGLNSNICVIVNHFGRLESTSFTNSLVNQTHVFDREDDTLPCAIEHPQHPPPPSSSRSSFASSIESSFQSNEVESCGDEDGEQKKSNKRKKLAALAGLSQSLARLLRNRLLVLRMLSGIIHILPIAGFYTFLPKYLVEQFRITHSSASAISGLAGILFVGFGAFMGGMIVRLFNVNSRLMTRWIAASALLYAIGMIVLMNLGCESNHIVHYDSQDFALTDCSASCKCSDTVYDPVCANGTTYISPCLAGCKSNSISEEKIIYDECGCTTNSQFTTNHTVPSSDLSEHVSLNVATQGHCQVDCTNLIWYIMVFSAFTLLHASCEVGSMMFNLRCVKSSERTLALGLITFVSSLLGTIPCSVIYGTVVDLTCIHWDTIETASLSEETGLTPNLDGRGACRVYDNDTFRYYLHGITASVMFIAFIIDCLISRYSNEVDFYDRSDSKADIRLGLKKSTETI